MATSHFSCILSALNRCGRVSILLNPTGQVFFISPLAYDLIIKQYRPEEIPKLSTLFEQCKNIKMLEELQAFQCHSPEPYHKQFTIEAEKKSLKVELKIKLINEGLTLIVLELLGQSLSLEPINEAQTLQAIIKNAPIGIWFVQADGHLSFFNRGFCASVEQPQKDFLNIDHYCENMPIKIAMGCATSDMKAIELDQAYTLQEYMGLKNGNKKFMEITKVPLRDSDGNIRGVIGISTDLTEIHNTRKDLAREKDRALITLSAIGDGVITTNRLGIIDFINPAAERLLGYHEKEVIGSPINNIFHRKDIKTRATKMVDVELYMRFNLPLHERSHSILLTKSEKELLIQDSIASILSSRNHPSGLVITFKDNTETKKLTEKLEHYSKRDNITGLLNRQEFCRVLEQHLNQNSKNKIFLLIDIDQFKIIINTAGNSAGNFLLKYVANILSEYVNEYDCLGRLSSDVFGLITDAKTETETKDIARSISQALKTRPFLWKGSQYSLSSSIGIIAIDDSTQSVDAIISRAHLACYAAKESGRGHFHFYKEDNKPIFKMQDELAMAQDIDHALRNGLFELYAQPIICLKDPNKKRIEILVRMYDREHRLVMPSHFISVAENYGLMPSIDAWILENLARRYMNDFLDNTNLTVNINLSGRSLSNNKLLKNIYAFLSKRTQLNQRLCFEITETSAISQLDIAIHFMNSLHGLGCQLALDDFGSGLSSFRYLKTLPIDIVKIDGSFVVNMDKDPIDRAMVNSIYEVSSLIGLEVVAEYVETEEIEAHLKTIGVDYAQGFHYGKPMKLSDYLANL